MESSENYLEAKSNLTSQSQKKKVSFRSKSTNLVTGDEESKTEMEYIQPQESNMIYK